MVTDQEEEKLLQATDHISHSKQLQGQEPHQKKVKLQRFQSCQQGEQIQSLRKPEPKEEFGGHEQSVCQKKEKIQLKRFTINRNGEEIKIVDKSDPKEDVGGHEQLVCQKDAKGQQMEEMEQMQEKSKDRCFAEVNKHNRKESGELDKTQSLAFQGEEMEETQKQAIQGEEMEETQKQALQGEEMEEMEEKKGEKSVSDVQKQGLCGEEGESKNLQYFGLQDTDPDQTARQVHREKQQVEVSLVELMQTGKNGQTPTVNEIHDYFLLRGLEIGKEQCEDLQQKISEMLSELKEMEKFQRQFGNMSKEEQAAVIQKIGENQEARWSKEAQDNKPKQAKDNTEAIWLKQFESICNEVHNFKPNQTNSVEIQEITPNLFGNILLLWSKREHQGPDFVMHLKLTQDLNQHQRDFYKQKVKYYPSIVLSIKGEVVKFEGQVLSKDPETGKTREGIENEWLKISTKQLDGAEYIYEGQVKGVEPEGQGTLGFYRNNRMVWKHQGTFANGKRHGDGKQVTSKGVTYVGKFENDLKSGHGLEIVMKKRKHVPEGEDPLVEKSRYQGDFVDGMRHGKGIQKTKHGEYEGEWSENVKCGKGVKKYQNGHFYEGEWENDCFHGEGVYIQKLTEETQNKYTGEFSNGYYEGKGTMEYANGDKYEGEWALGKKEGNGMYEWIDGDYYDGDWKNDMADGNGVASFGGLFYDGQFSMGQKHGLGEETNEQGDVIKAMWANNEIMKKLEINGEVIEDDQNV